MADNTQLGPGAGGDLMGTDDIGGVKYQRNKLIHGADGVNDGDVSASNPLPVTLGLTDAQLRAAPVPISGTFWQGTQPVSFTWQGLTDAQLRASAVPVSGPLTDAQIRATALPVSGTVNVSNMVAQGLTDTQLRATAVPVSGTFWQATQPISAASLPLPTGAAASLAQASTTSGQTGVLMQAAVTTAAPTYTTGQTNPLSLDISGGLRVAVHPVTQSGTWTVGVTGYPTAAASADALANPTVTKIDALPSTFNGSTWDRTRGNTAITAEASSAKVASGNSAAALTNHNASGVQLFVNVSAASGTTPTLAVRVQVQDPVSSTWFDLPGAVTASITGVSTALLTIYPGVTVAANSAVSAPLPRTWRLAWTIGGTTPSFTFSVGAQYIL